MIEGFPLLDWADAKISSESRAAICKYSQQLHVLKNALGTLSSNSWILQLI